MKQKKLIKKVFQACLEGDNDKMSELRVEEFKKIFKRKEQNKPFTARWTSVRI